MSKLNKVLLGVVVLLLIVLAFILLKPNFAKMMGQQYYAVYLTDGSLYFGKMVWYKPHVLMDVRLIQTKQATAKDEPASSLVKFSDAVWGPSSEIKINEKNILWTTKLSDSSQVLQLINNGK